MNLHRMTAAAFLALALVSLGTGTAAAQTDEERYVQEITALLIEADILLDAASDALADCLATFSACVEDRSPFIERLNASRTGLESVRADVLAIHVPVRYRGVNDLVVNGLTNSIQGTSLHMEGLQDGSLEKIQAGSVYMAQGREELGEAANQLQANPPRSHLDEILPVLLVAIAGSVAVSILLILRLYRREVRTRAPSLRRKESS